MTIKEAQSIHDQLDKILKVVEQGNPSNFNINNGGLARLGRLLNYTPERKDIADKVRALIVKTYPNTHEGLLKSLKQYHFTSFYTPPNLINWQLDLLERNNIQPKRILEPSAGNGAYVFELSKRFPNAEIVALEPDVLSYNILQANNLKRDNVTTINKTFEEYYLEQIIGPGTDPKFDLILSNIPFTDLQIKNSYLYDDYLITNSHKTVNNFMNVNHLDLLANGGISMILTSNNFMDKNSYRELRKANMSKANLLQAVRLDNETFSNEKTKVVSDIIIYQRDYHKQILSQYDKAFIASVPITVDGNEFQLNGYFHANDKRVQGVPTAGVFHNKPALTYDPYKTDNADQLKVANEHFFSTNEISFSNTIQQQQIARIFNDIQLEKPITPVEESLDPSPLRDNEGKAQQKQDEALNEEQVEKVELDEVDPISEEGKQASEIADKINSTSPKLNQDLKNVEEHRLININDELYLKNNTTYFSPGFQFKNNVPSFYQFDQKKARAVSRSSALIVADYISLKTGYTLLRENARRGLYNPEAFIKAKNNLLDEHATFSFKYESLFSAYVMSHKINRDSMFDELGLQLEKYQLEKIQLQKLDETLVLSEDPNIIASNRTSSTTTGSTKIAKTNKDDTKDSGKNNIDDGSVSNQIEFTSSNEQEIPLENLMEMTVGQIALMQYDRTGNIDVNGIALIKGISPKEVLEQGLESDTFFLNPIFNEYDDGAFKGYKPSLIHLLKSGHIDNKINVFKKQPLPYDLTSDAVIQALKEVRPEELDIKDIEFNFESPFIPRDAKIAFFKEKINEVVTFDVLQFNSSIKLNFSLKNNTAASTMYSVSIDEEEKMGYKDILRSFANQKYPTVTYTVKYDDGSSKTFVDKKATVLAHQKYEMAQAQFKTFIMNDVRYKERIEKAYYDTFLADKNYTNDKNILTFPDTLEHDPYEHQKNAVLHGIEKGTALFDHKVGHGKTATMAMLSYKLLQHKKSKRILITTIKAVSAQLKAEIKKNFPNKKMYLLRSSQLAPKKINQTLKYLRDNKDIEIIIGTHQHLQKIPKHIEVITSVLGRKLDLIEKDLETAYKYGQKESKQAVKSLEKKKISYENKLQGSLAKQQKKSANIHNITLSSLKIDTLLIDESHHFKNIGYTTRHSNVSGLNNPRDSDKGLDLEMTIESIHQRRDEEKGIFFFTGTPIINSVTEVYAILRQLRPKKLEEMGILSFDQFASVFLKQDVQLETDILGNPKSRPRFRYFTNMPELAKLYHSVAHISDDRTFKTHEITVKEHFRKIEPTDNILKLRDLSVDFIKTKNQSWLNKTYEPEQLTAAMVIALQLNRAALCDPLTVNEKLATMQFTEKDQVKIHALMEDVYENYTRTNEHKGVTLIFSNEGVPGANKEYDTYSSIKKQLHEKYGIPLHEIGLIHDANTSKKEEQFQKDVRDGTIRVAIGSTEKLGTGKNIQTRVSAICHLDIPYSPKDYDQRNGRGERKGNWIMTLEEYKGVLPIYFYGIKETSDIFSMGLNKHKQLFRDQIKYNTGARIYDASLGGDENDLSYDMMQAALMGDLESFQLNMVKAQIKKLDDDKTIFDMSKNEAEGRIEKAKERIIEHQSTITKTKEAFNSISPFIPKLTSEDTVKETQEKTLKAFKDLAPGQFMHMNSFEELSMHLQSKIDTGFNSDYQIVAKFYLDPERPRKESYLVCEREYNHFKEKNKYRFGFSHNGMALWNNHQYSFSPDTLPYQLFKAVKNNYQQLNFIRQDIRRDETTIKLNSDMQNQQYPEEKSTQFKELKQEESRLETIINNKGRGI